MGDYNLGTARGKIVIESDGKGIEQANSQLASLDQRQQRGAAAAQTLGKGMLAVGGAALAGFAVAVNSAADFESQLSGIQAVSQGTEEQMEAVRKKALQLGADTKFSAGEAAAAFEELARRGISLQDIIDGAADATVNLAAATGTDIVTAATVASNAMNVFGIQASDLDRVVNQIAGFDVVGSSVEDFNLALQQSGAVADLVGLSFEDLTTAIAAMSKAGINGSDAGTSLKTMLNNLQPTTKKQIGLATELGILGSENNKLTEKWTASLKAAQARLASTTEGTKEYNDAQKRVQVYQDLITQSTIDGSNAFYDQQGNIRSLADISNILGTALQGLTDQQRQQALETLFGSDAIRAAAVIAEEAGDGIFELQDQIAAVDAGEQAATRMDNLAGSIEQLKGSIETYLIGAGTPFLDSIRGIVDALTDLINFFGSLPAPVQKAISQFVLFAGIAFVTAGGLAYFLGTFVKFASAVSAFKGLFTLGKGAQTAASGMQALNLAFLANPIFLIIVAIIALGVALVVLYKKSEAFRNFVNGLWADIKDAFEKVKTFFEGIPAFFSGLWDDVKGVFNDFKGFLSDFFGAFNLDNIFGGIAAAGEEIGQKLGDAAGPVVDFFSNLEELPQKAAAAMSGAAKKVLGFVTGLPKEVAKGFGKMLSVAGDFLSELPNQIAYWLGFAIGRWIRFHIDLVTETIKLGVNVVKAFVNFLTEIPGHVARFATDVLTAFINFSIELEKMWIQLWIDVITFAIQKLSEFIAWLPGFVSSVIAQIISFAGQMASWALRIGTDFLNGIVNFVSQLPGRIAGFIGNIISSFPGWAASFGGGALSMGTSFVNGLINGIGDLVGLVKNMVLGAINGVSDLGQTAYNKMKSLGESMWSGFKKGLFGSPHTKVEYAVWDMTDNVKKSISTLAGQVDQILRIGQDLPGMSVTAPAATFAASTAALAGEPSSTAVQSNPAQMTWQQLGPLIGEATIRDERDIDELARQLDERIADRLAAAGRRTVFGGVS